MNENEPPLVIVSDDVPEIDSFVLKRGILEE